MKMRPELPRDRVARRRAEAEAGLAAALEALAEAQAELTDAIKAQIAFDNRDLIVAQQRARKAAYERARTAQARRDAERHMALAGDDE